VFQPRHEVAAESSLRGSLSSSIESRSHKPHVTDHTSYSQSKGEPKQFKAPNIIVAADDGSMSAEPGEWRGSLPSRRILSARILAIWTRLRGPRASAGRSVVFIVRPRLICPHGVADWPFGLHILLHWLNAC
jgi:hypothetical protein